MKFLLLFCVVASSAWADGHGPVFGYGTAILGAGDIGVGSGLMWRSGVTMVGPLISYGLTSSVQLSLSTPFHLDHGEHPVGRFTAMMPGVPEVELSSAWRFHHHLTGVGTRFESTLYTGASLTTQHLPRTDGSPLRRAPGVSIGAATGYISRRFYALAGAGFERYATVAKLDHQSSTLLGSLVFGWRPSLWNRNSSTSDLRFFWESTGERVGEAWRSAAEPAGPPHQHDEYVPLASASPGGIIYLTNSGRERCLFGPVVSIYLQQRRSPGRCTVCHLARSEWRAAR